MDSHENMANIVLIGILQFKTTNEDSIIYSAPNALYVETIRNVIY